MSKFGVGVVKHTNLKQLTYKRRQEMWLAPRLMAKGHGKTQPAGLPVCSDAWIFLAPCSMSSTVLTPSQPYCPQAFCSGMSLPVHSHTVSPLSEPSSGSSSQPFHQVCCLPPALPLLGRESQNTSPGGKAAAQSQPQGAAMSFGLCFCRNRPATRKEELV